MKLFLIGSGGREHAVAWALRRTNPQLKIFCAPGNAGIETVTECVPINVSDTQRLLKFAATESVDLSVVGPELPLAAGLVDEFVANGLKVFGPTKAAARLEASKSFAKDFMARHQIPTARFHLAHSSDQALRILRSQEFDCDSGVVLKADGLAAGKGVIVAHSLVEAEGAVRELERSGLGGTSDRPLVIEEALTGPEASVLAFADGKDYLLMPPARDHKRIGENETGPNTGGMGTVTSDSLIDEKVLQEIKKQIVELTLEGAEREGFPFRGVLFVGLMLTSEGPKVLEYNVRFGDPETQAILVRLESNLLTVFEAATQGKLAGCEIVWGGGASACVVLANRGYPGKVEAGAKIEGLPQLGINDPLQIFHAGTSRGQNGELIASGGRVLGITSTGRTLPEALNRCYEVIESICWEGMQFRRDIGRGAC